MTLSLERPPTHPGPAGALAQALVPGFFALANRQGLLLALKDGRDSRYLWVNEALSNLMGCRPAEAVGRTDADLFEPALAKSLRSAEQSALAHDGALGSEHHFELRGERREFMVLRSNSQVEGRSVLCCIWQDLAAEHRREAQLKGALEQIEREQQASALLRRELSDQGLRDAATGLYTSAHFEDQLRRDVDLSNREHREFALVHIALDELQEPARALGARALERLHEVMGRLLRGNTRAMDASCRIDERHFAVLLSGVGLATAHSRMEGLRRQVAAQIVVLDGQELHFTVSMGVASFPHTAQSKDEVVQASQSALAQARVRGGNTVALASIRFGELS